MAFLSLSFYNFRNLQNDKIDFDSKEVYFVGQNGQGKSNILESLYYCAYGNSFRTHSDTEIVRRGEKDFSVRALYQESGGGGDFRCGCQKGNRHLDELRERSV